MDSMVFLAVLVAAAFHAGWNALLKLRLEPMIAIALISALGGLVTLPLAAVADAPQPAAWGYLAASLAIHLVYYLALTEAYRLGDLGQVYPIARGSAPLLTALITTVWLGDRLGLAGWVGIGVLGSAILMLAVWGSRERGRFDGRTVGFAVLTAVAIASYTVVDGIGARLAGSALGYIVWLMVLDGAMMLIFGWFWAGGRLLTDLRGNWVTVLAGGALSVTAYGIVIWAMTVAPIALVAALRETSVLFAALIGIVVLREPVRASRLLAAALAVVGVLLIRFR
ncbi:MAG: EamA family transporter [Hyphomicrobiaceae bacterium]